MIPLRAHSIRQRLIDVKILAKPKRGSGALLINKAVQNKILSPVYLL